MGKESSGYGGIDSIHLVHGGIDYNGQRPNASGKGQRPRLLRRNFSHFLTSNYDNGKCKIKYIPCSIGQEYILYMEHKGKVILAQYDPTSGVLEELPLKEKVQGMV